MNGSEGGHGSSRGSCSVLHLFASGDMSDLHCHRVSGPSLGSEPASEAHSHAYLKYGFLGAELKQVFNSEHSFLTRRETEGNKNGIDYMPSSLGLDIIQTGLPQEVPVGRLKEACANSRRSGCDGEVRPAYKAAIWTGHTEVLGGETLDIVSSGFQISSLGDEH